MSYCTVDDVQALLSAANIVLSDTSSVTVEQVKNEILPMLDRYIDDRLGKYYQTPITGTNALQTVRRIEKYLAAAEVAQRIYVGQSPSDSPMAQTWRQFAEDDLQRITGGEVILFDAVPLGDAPEPIYKQVSDKLSQPTYPTPPLFSVGKQF